MNVRWKNRAPEVDEEELNKLIEEINISSVFSNSGISHAYKGEDINSLVLILKENSNIELELPPSIFKDADSGVLTRERLGIEMKDKNDLEFNDFNFDSSSLKIIGDTHGKGLNASDGSQEWKYVITGTDNAEEEINLEITMKLQRSINEPILNTRVEREYYNENEYIGLNDLFTLRSEEKPDEILYLSIQHTKQDGQSIDIRNESDNYDIEPVVEEKSSKIWQIHGTLEEVRNKLNNLNIYTTSESKIDEDYEIVIAVYNQLGETNVVSERIEEKIYIKFEAVPTIPEWVERKDISINEAFDMQPVGDYIKANVDDKKEIITYLIQIPEERNDLIFSDSQGNIIGKSTTNGVIMTSEEWEGAILRSRESILIPAELNIIASSTEPSNNKSVESTPKMINWIASPIITQEVEVNLISAERPQAGGSITKIPLDFDLPDGTNSAIIQVELNEGNKLVIDQEKLINSNQSDVYLIRLTEEEIKSGELAWKLEIKIQKALAVS